MSLKDNPALITIAACAATAAATWTVSEQVRVLPLREKVTAAADRNRSAPVITDVRLTKIGSAGSILEVEQNISYTDPEGDAVFVNLQVLGTNAKDLTVTSVALKAAPEEQKSGATSLSTWTCGPTSYFVKFRVVVTDKAGHASNPRDFTINCN